VLGDGIRNNQNIFRKIITNNSENNYKLSYTPKPLLSTVQSRTVPETSFTREINPKIENLSPEK
jgi:hypothetical protein